MVRLLAFTLPDHTMKVRRFGGLDAERRGQRYIVEVGQHIFTLLRGDLIERGAAPRADEKEHGPERDRKFPHASGHRFDERMRQTAHRRVDLQRQIELDGGVAAAVPLGVSATIICFAAGSPLRSSTRANRALGSNRPCSGRMPARIRG